MDKRIITFLQNNHILSLAVASKDEVYSASCFYVWDKERNALLFASDPATRHMQHIQKNPLVAGTVHRCTNDIAKIQGIQFQGAVQKATKSQTRLYLQKFPIATMIETEFWAIKLHWIKLTDNTLGFKKKIIWQDE